MKNQNLLLTTLPKYINLYINHNLTIKLNKILILISKGSPNTRYIHQTHYVPNHRETKAYKICIYDLDIPKDELTNLELKTFNLTLELNPQI